jgi:hypothetical protein
VKARSWVERTFRRFSSWLAIDGGARRRVRAPELPILVNEDVGLKSESFSMVTAGAIAGPGRYFWMIDCEKGVRRLCVIEISGYIVLLSDSTNSGWRGYTVRGKGRGVEDD